MNGNRWTLVLTWSLLVLALVLMGLMAGQSSHAQPVEVAPPRAELRVCSEGPPTCDYAAIQDAVDAAVEGDVVKVAAGVYTGVQARPAPPGYDGPAVIVQVVYLSKTLSIQGGYTLTNWTEPDPGANPTTLDAEGQGRVLLIAGTISPTVESLRFTGGDATGLGGGHWGDDIGGGVYVVTATATISGCVVYSNTASTAWEGGGGGLYFDGSSATLNGNMIRGNVASTVHTGRGGGLYLHASDVILSNNVVRDNIATEKTWDGFGGGLYLESSDVALNDCIIVGNTTGESLGYAFGGGLASIQSNVILNDNLIADNYTRNGGGLYFDASSATLTGNTIISNVANKYLGGARFAGSPTTLTNNIVADNYGGGLALFGSDHLLMHNTIARNTGGDGYGLLVSGWPPGADVVVMTDTILVGHQVGIYIDLDPTIIMEGTLWGSEKWANDQDWGGSGGTVITGTINIYDDPAFVSPDAGDYHLCSGSAAIDTGVDAGISVDMDGDPRPMGLGFDIGADEFDGPVLAIVKEADPDPVGAGAHLTYTLRLTNTGPMSFTATVTDLLPAHVTPGGVVTWTLAPLPPDGVWNETVVVTVDVDYTGLLTNVVYATAEEGAAGAYTRTVTVVDTPIEGLAAINDSPTVLGEATTLTATIAAGSNVTYTWALGDGAFGGGAVVSHTYPAVGVYTAVVTASNSLGELTAMTTVTITGEEIPIEGLMATNDSPTVLGEPTTLTATVTAGSNVAYTWALGDSTFDGGAVVTHIYSAEGVYTAVVTASNNVSELTATTRVTIAAPGFSVYLPLVVKDH